MQESAVENVGNMASLPATDALPEHLPLLHQLRRLLLGKALSSEHMEHTPALQNHRPARLLLGCHLVCGLCHAGDRSRHGRGGYLVAVAGRRLYPLHPPRIGAYRGPARDRRHLVLADHFRVSERGRQLHRLEREPGNQLEPDCGRGIADRLCADGVRFHRVGRSKPRRGSLSDPLSPRKAPGSSVPLFHCAADYRQPARPERVGGDICRPYLHLRRHVLPDDRSGAVRRPGGLARAHGADQRRVQPCAGRVEERAAQCGSHRHSWY